MILNKKCAAFISGLAFAGTTSLSSYGTADTNKDLQNVSEGTPSFVDFIYKNAVTEEDLAMPPVIAAPVHKNSESFENKKGEENNTVVDSANKSIGETTIAETAKPSETLALQASETQTGSQSGENEVAEIEESENSANSQIRESVTEQNGAVSPETLETKETEISKPSETLTENGATAQTENTASNETSSVQASEVQTGSQSGENEVTKIEDSEGSANSQKIESVTEQNSAISPETLETKEAEISKPSETITENGAATQTENAASNETSSVQASEAQTGSQSSENEVAKIENSESSANSQSMENVPAQDSTVSPKTLETKETEISKPFETLAENDAATQTENATSNETSSVQASEAQTGSQSSENEMAKITETPSLDISESVEEKNEIPSVESSENVEASDVSASKESLQSDNSATSNKKISANTDINSEQLYNFENKVTPRITKKSLSDAMEKNGLGSLYTEKDSNKEKQDDGLLSNIGYFIKVAVVGAVTFVGTYFCLAKMKNSGDSNKKINPGKFDPNQPGNNNIPGPQNNS